MASIEKSFDLPLLQRFCERLAAQLRAGDALLLNGPLGSGKTQFVTCLAQSLGSVDQVSSPTYGLANFYQTSHVPVLHIDTYRLEDQAEFRQLGLDEYFDSHLVLVEWGAKVQSDFEDPLEVAFDFAGGGANDGTRTLTFSFDGTDWQARVEQALKEIE